MHVFVPREHGGLGGVRRVDQAGENVGMCGRLRHLVDGILFGVSVHYHSTGLVQPPRLVGDLDVVEAGVVLAPHHLDVALDLGLFAGEEHDGGFEVESLVFQTMKAGKPTTTKREINPVVMPMKKGLSKVKPSLPCPQ